MHGIHPVALLKGNEMNLTISPPDMDQTDYRNRGNIPGNIKSQKTGTRYSLRNNTDNVPINRTRRRVLLTFVAVEKQ
jgi:hypothetical protein